MTAYYFGELVVKCGKFIPSLYKCKITEALYPGFDSILPAKGDMHSYFHDFLSGSAVKNLLAMQPTQGTD